MIFFDFCSVLWCQVVTGQSNVMVWKLVFKILCLFLLLSNIVITSLGEEGTGLFAGHHMVSECTSIFYIFPFIFSSSRLFLSSNEVWCSRLFPLLELVKYIYIWASSWESGTSHWRPAKAQTSLHICAVSPEPSLFRHIRYGRRQKVRPKIRHLAPLDGSACALKEWIYGGRKVP